MFFTMKKNNVDELICRLMSGETTPEEERQLLQLLRSQSSLSSEEKAILQFLDAAFQGRPQAMREADAESILPSENADEKRIVKRKGWGLRQIAAAVLLLLCLSGISYAAIRWLAPRQEKRSEEVANQTETMAQMENHEKDSVVTYNNVRFDRILEQDTENADLTMLYAQYLIAKNMNKEAKPVLWKLLQIDPTNSGGRMTLLQDAIREEDYNAIIDLCEGGVEASPEALEFYYYLSIAYAHEQRHDDVIPICKQALEHVNENSTKEIVSDFYSMMGDTYHTQGNMTEAYQAYEKAIETYGNNVGALNNYAYYLSLEKRDLDKAEEMSYKTVKAEPENGTYLDTYAWILFVKGNYTQAKLYIDMAMKADGDKSADVVEHCGDIYYMAGETAAAVEYWKQALELGSQSAKLKQKINQKKYVE